jgi:nicotinamide riboside kinase
MVGMATIDASQRAGLTAVLVGAESSGKTTLARQLSRRLGAPWLPEYARRHLAGRAGYTADDVLTIARAQHAAEQRLVASGHSLLLVDTDLLVTRIWSEVRFGACPAWIDTTLRSTLAAPRRRLYLLPRPDDVPWTADRLRENPYDRDMLHERYRAALVEMGATFVELGGTRRERVGVAEAAVLAALRR